jgi:DNA-3-methyladenine glycosylase II
MSTSFFINPGAPFDFEKSAGMHGRFQKNLLDLYEGGVYKRVVYLRRRPVLIIASSKGTTEKPRIQVDAYPALSIPEERSLRDLLHIMLGSRFDYNGFRRVARKDRVMSMISRELTGLRPIAPPTIFEALVIAITEQQISLDAAIAIRSRLIEKYGDTVRFDRRIFYAFPTPKSLAAAKPSQMRSVGLSRSKALFINELARKVERGELDLEGLRTMDDGSAIAELTKIKGIGRWSAEYALIRGMGRVNSLPADDLGIQRAVSRTYFKGKKVSSKEVRRVLDKFAPYSGIAAFYLMYYLFWRSKEAQDDA